MHREAEQELYGTVTAMAAEDEDVTIWKARFCKLVAAVKPVLTYQE